MTGRALIVLSGGMDSTTAAYLYANNGYQVDGMSFSYGQKHAKELTFAQGTMRALGGRHAIVPMSFLKTLLKSSLTTPDEEVPEGHYADENMKATVVPNRNAIMISIAAGVAISEGHDVLVVGVHAGDHPVYPDCRPLFINTMNQLIKVGNEGFAKPGFQLDAPFLSMTKDQIVSIGERFSIPWAKTWSCYNGREKHCGRCGTCVERREAFSLAGVVDPTEYEEASQSV